MVAEMDVYYDGSRIFSWVSDLSGLPLDQVSSIYTYVTSLKSYVLVIVCKYVKWLHQHAQFLCLLGDSTVWALYIGEEQHLNELFTRH
jgi:hypothetical protein